MTTVIKYIDDVGKLKAKFKSESKIFIPKILQLWKSPRKYNTLQLRTENFINWKSKDVLTMNS